MAWAGLRFGRSEAPDQPAPGPLRCPACHRHDCVPSLPTRAFDRLFLSLHRVPYDCRACGRRFRVFDRKQAAELLAAWEAAAF